MSTRTPTAWILTFMLLYTSVLLSSDQNMDHSSKLKWDPVNENASWSARAGLVLLAIGGVFLIGGVLSLLFSLQLAQ